MKHLLLSSIIAMLAVPAFAASSLTCDASGIGATTPNARMKASWTPNVYNLEWYDYDGTLLNVQSSAQTCAYGSNLTVPNTPPTKIGYTFIGWEKEEIAIISNPLANLDTSIEPTDFAAILFDESAEPDSQTVASYGLTNPGTLAMTFSYGDIYMEASCNSTSVSGGDFLAAISNNIWAQNLTEEEEELQRNQLYSNFNFVTRQSNTFTRGSNGDVCWCRVYGYKPTNGTMQSTSDAQWVMIANLATTPTGQLCSVGECEYEYTSCNDVCPYLCVEFSFLPRLRAYLYGQQ